MSLIEYNNWFKRNRVFKADSHDLQVESLVYAPTANSLFVQLRSNEGHEFDLRCVANITGAVTLYVAKKSDSFTPLKDLEGLRSWLIPQLSVPVPHSSGTKSKRKRRFKQKNADTSSSYSVNAW